MRYYKAVQHVRQIGALDKPPIRQELVVSLYIGKPGTGKTRAAYEEDGDLYALPLGKDLWFDNYAGEKTLLLDDFSGELRLVDLLRLLDVYPIQVPVKGSFVYLQAIRIIITSNVSMEYWYDYVSRQDSLDALKRRIHHVVEFNDVFVDLSSDEVLTEEELDENILTFIEQLESEQPEGALSQ